MIRNYLPLTVATLLCGFLIPSGCQAVAQRQQIVMRDLTTVAASEATWGPLGIDTSDGRHFDWDEVLSANLVDASDQGKFDRHLATIGRPLYLLRHRLLNRDWLPLYEIAEPIYRKQLEQRTNKKNKRVHYLAAVGAFYGRLAHGKRAGALASFLRACKIRNAFTLELPELASVDFSGRQLRARYTPQILPIWFEGETTADMGELDKCCFGGTAEDWPNGTLLYALSRSISSRDQSRAKTLWSILQSRSGELIQLWRPVLECQMELLAQRSGPATNALRTNSTQLPFPARAVAEHLVVSEADRTGEDRDVVVLDLLGIVAKYGQQLPHLSAAALYRATQILDAEQRTRETQILRTELLHRYANTYHGRLPSKN